MHLSTLITILCSFEVARAAGIGAHLTFLIRVLSSQDAFGSKFNVADPNYYPWLKSGAFFPDALYTCDINNKLWHEFAEYTHWPPFLTTSIEYWHRKYGSNDDLKYSNSSLQLIAFLYGIFNHQVVDTSWHSLVNNYTEHGLLKVLGELEFGGSINDAHSYIDVIGDTLILSDMLENMPSLDASFIWEFYTDSNWKLPSKEDLDEIISLSGFSNEKITYEDINECVSRGMYSVNVEARLISTNSVFYNRIAYEKSPKGREFIKNHWLGGEYDILNLILECSSNFLEFFEDEKISDLGHSSQEFCRNLPLSRDSQKNSVNDLITTEFSSFTQYTTRIPFSKFGDSIITGTFYSSNAEYIAVTAPYEDNRGSVYLIPIDEAKNHQKFFELQSFPVVPHFGTSLGKISHDGSDILLIADATRSTIHFHQNGIEINKIELSHMNLNQLEILTVYQNQTSKESIVIIGDKYYGDNELGTILFLRINVGPDLRIARNDNNTADLSHRELWRNYSHLGSAALVTDQNILITAEGPGVVVQCSHEFISDGNFSKCGSIFEDKVSSELNFQSLEIQGSNRNGNFGRIIKKVKIKNRSYILISQEVMNKIYIYEETKSKICYLAVLTISTVLQPIPKSVKFGYSIVYDEINDILYISSPGYNSGKGAIWYVPMSEIINNPNAEKKILLNPRENLLIENKMNSAVSRSFGNSLGLSSDGKLIIGIPDYVYNELGSLELAGSILVSDI